MNSINKYKEPVAKLLGYSLAILGIVLAIFFSLNLDLTKLIYPFVLWCFLTGFWALFTSCLFYPGGRKAPKAFVYGKTARILGLLLLLVPFYFLILILSHG